MPVAEQRREAPSGGEDPAAPARAPEASPTAPRATRELLDRTFGDLAELVQTEEARYHRSIHQRLVDGLKALDHVYALVVRNTP